MSRIRSIKPEWLEDEKLAASVDFVRVLSLGLIVLADDHGIGRANPTWLGGQVWGYLDDPRERLARVSGGLARLSEIDFVTLYEVRVERYYSIRNWKKHQKVDHPAKPRLPWPSDPAARIILADPRENVAKVSATVAPDQDRDQDLRPPTTDPDQDQDIVVAPGARAIPPDPAPAVAVRVYLDSGAPVFPSPLLPEVARILPELADGLDGYLDGWLDAYRHLDVVQQLREMRAKSGPAHRFEHKTVANWLKTADNHRLDAEGRAARAAEPLAKTPPEVFEALTEIASASSGRFLWTAETLGKAGAVIRAALHGGHTMSDFRILGSYFAAGGPPWAEGSIGPAMLRGSIGNLIRDALNWDAAGRPRIPGAHADASALAAAAASCRDVDDDLEGRS